MNEKILNFMSITTEKQEELNTVYNPCEGCTNEGRSKDIVGTSCYRCIRNPVDRRIDYYDKKTIVKRKVDFDND